MIKSMTGYGRSNFDGDGLKIQVEVKTLNSKYLDALIKLPKEFSDKEFEVKTMVSEALQRGKVNLTIDFESAEPIATSTINEPLFKSFYTKLKSLAGETESNLANAVLQMPDVISSSQQRPDENTWSRLKSLIQEAINNCDNHRVAEGNSLKPSLESSIKTIESKLTEVKKADPDRIDSIKKRIGNNLEEHIGKENIDKNRFEQEVIYFLEKLDINEEKVRLQSHLDYFIKTLNSDSSQGKKLGFITQEIGREINTIGSKANHAIIQHLVVEMKEELEKIREQLLNVI
ncbi:MAG: YicC/YloC family endoribonuclease [Cyclobacteriaceae bacterium]